MPVHGRSIEDQAAVIMVLMTERARKHFGHFPVLYWQTMNALFFDGGDRVEVNALKNFSPSSF